MKQSTNLVRG